MILDSRPRWETRYLNNLFERDERWEVSCVWGRASSKARKYHGAMKLVNFHLPKKNFFKYDLILFGEVTSEEFSIEEQNWIVDFVTQRAGGILL